MFERIPLELQQRAQWVCWRYEYRDSVSGKPTKVPVTPGNGHLASVTDPSSWRSFAEAVAFARAWPQHIAGIGFVFVRSGGYVGIDGDGAFDDATDPETRERMLNILRTFNSYAEYSPSKKGYHIIVKGELPSGKRYKGVEVYPHERFFTFTGELIDGFETVEPRQYLLDVLFQEMQAARGVVTQIGQYVGDPIEREDDRTIYDRAMTARNGAVFEMLWSGQWDVMTKPDGSKRFPSQSEADFALMDILGFYTQAPLQLIRLFRASALGKREKAERTDYLMYMVNRAFDNKPPPVNLDGLFNEMQEARSRFALGDAAPEPAAYLPPLPESMTALPPATDLLPGVEPVAVPSPAIDSANPYTRPPGLLGDLADFIYRASNRPVREIALAAAIGLMGGICGQAYNVSGTGLNVYVILVAPTGTGKEFMSRGIDRVIAEMSEFSSSSMYPAIKLFRGPNQIASGQALSKNFVKQPSCVVVLGEFGLKFQSFAHSTNPNELQLKAALLDLYNKSGRGQVVYPHIYSDRDKNTDAIQSPALTLLCETTPETFYEVVDERVIRDGFLPRFSVFEYMGPRVPDNPAGNSVKLDDEVREKLKSLCKSTHELMAGLTIDPPRAPGLTDAQWQELPRIKQQSVNDVRLSADAYRMAQEFDAFCDQQINGAPNDAIRHVWNRAHVKALKLAALCAVGQNWYSPEVNADDFAWSKAIIVHEINMLLRKFERGDLAEKNPFKADEQKQFRELARVVHEYLSMDYALLRKKGYRVTAAARNAFLIPQAYMQQRCANLSAFKKDRKSTVDTLRAALTFFRDLGILSEVNLRQKEIVEKIGETNAAHWYVTDYDGLVQYAQK